ncbi:MAG TPA: hypothetical protein PLS46_14970, partial [Microthrixaceae bacterium]|nr:hypothetical protein [Microthrixaceae bacterium]
VLGTSLLVGLSLGSTHVPVGAAAGSVSPVGDPAIRAARGAARLIGGDQVAPSSDTRIDVVPHAAERGLARRTYPWGIDGPVTPNLAIAVSSTLVFASSRQSRRVVRCADLPARAPPHLALG